MNSLQDDIIKYKNGQLSPKEMHALEKKALGDPFLADALEGIENISSQELSKDIADLNQKILKPKKTILFTPLRIAAAVLLVAASAITLYQLRPTTSTIALNDEKPNVPASESKKEPIVETQKQLPKQEQKVALSKKDNEPKTINRLAENAKPKISKPIEKEKIDGAHQAEISVSADEKQPDITVAKTLSVPEKKAEEVTTETKDAPVSIAMQPTQQLAADEDAKREKVTARARKSASKLDVASGIAAGATQGVRNRITGKVTSADDGTPLPGVNVVVEGTTEGTVTDTEGNYSLQPSSEDSKLIFSFIGMETREENINGKVKVDVSLKQDVSQLSEVVVSGYGVKRDSDAEPIVHLASPIGGMRAYNKYLDTNLRYPPDALKDNIKGKVKVEFSVKTDGRLDDYKVVKSLGHGCDEEVIRLIKDGPKWSPSTENGQPVESTVLVGVKFDPAKAGR